MAFPTNTELDAFFRGWGFLLSEINDTTYLLNQIPQDFHKTVLTVLDLLYKSCPYNKR